MGSAWGRGRFFVHSGGLIHAGGLTSPDGLAARRPNPRGDLTHAAA